MNGLYKLPLLGLSAVLFHPDFSALLSKPMDDIKRPKPLVDGTYLGIIGAYKFDEVDTPKDAENPKKTVLRLTGTLTEALEDVDQADLNEALDGGELRGKPWRYDFWLTNDAQWRVVEACRSAGIETHNRSLGECIPELVNKVVQLHGSKTASKRPGDPPDTFFWNVDSLVGVEPLDA